MMKARIKTMDLHIHTTVSDGTDTPSEILSRVRNAGLDLFSVADHDAIRACQEISAMRTDEDPRFLNGIEFSCRDEGGSYHILGYGYDADAAPIRAVVELGHNLRMKKVRARLSFLRDAFGFSFSQEEIDALLKRENPGKPHIGNLMVKYGYAQSKEDAIRNYINKKKFPTSYVRPETAIEGIRQSGGIPVLAHPSYGSGEELIAGSDMEERLKRLLDVGLEGVEAYYSGFSNKLQEELLSYAKKYHLYVTAGSDYHGKNKLIPLGDTNLPDVSVGAEGVHRFLEAVSDRIR